MPQYFSRTNKALTTSGAPPAYGPDGVLNIDTRASFAIYSANGKYLAYASGQTHVLDAETGAQVCTVDVNAADITFSPQANFFVTWTRGKKTEDGNWIPNLKVWNLSGELVYEIVQKGQGSWMIQWSADEKYVAWQPNNTTLHIGEGFGKQVGKLSIPEGICQFKISPGRNPSVACFIFGTKGKPSSVRIYKLPSAANQVAGRTFFKVDGVKLMWNPIGTSLIVWATTDHDASGKTYYGEASLFLLNVNSGQDQRIALDKEGPIHDVAWSPNSDEFGVTYGYMPSKTCFFDTRGNAVNVLPVASRNSLSYSPHGRFVTVSGYGNIQGDTDVYDRHAKWNKVCTFKASNTSFFQWSPDGRYILTATTSPRLRVDNGVKIWHYTGKLVYHQKDEELFSVAWRPETVALNLAEPCSEPDASVAGVKVETAGAAAVKSAYTPPHLRGKSAGPSKATSLHQRVMQLDGSLPEPSKAALKNQQKRANKRGDSPAADSGAAASAPASSVVSPEEKQLRSLHKKLRAIQELKERRDKGEKLEITQVNKISTEADILKKLEGLGWHP